MVAPIRMMSPRLDIGQKRVLLRLVEAMDFVDEQDRAAAELAQPLGIGHHGFDFLDPGQHGAEGKKLALRHARDDARQRGLADARRSPENERRQLIALDLRAQRLARAEDVLLPGEVVERFGTHAVGQRTLVLSDRRADWIEEAQARNRPRAPAARARFVEQHRRRNRRVQRFDAHRRDRDICRDRRAVPGSRRALRCRSRWRTSG